MQNTQNRTSPVLSLIQIYTGFDRLAFNAKPGLQNFVVIGDPGQVSIVEHSQSLGDGHQFHVLSSQPGVQFPVGSDEDDDGRVAEQIVICRVRFSPTVKGDIRQQIPRNFTGLGRRDLVDIAPCLLYTSRCV